MLLLFTNESHTGTSAEAMRRYLGTKVQRSGETAKEIRTFFCVGPWPSSFKTRSTQSTQRLKTVLIRARGLIVNAITIFVS